MSEKSSAKSSTPYKRPNKSKKNESILGSSPDPATKLPNVAKKLRKGDTPIVDNMETDENYDEDTSLDNTNLLSNNDAMKPLTEEPPLISLSDNE